MSANFFLSSQRPEFQIVKGEFSLISANSLEIFSSKVYYVKRSIQSEGIDSDTTGVKEGRTQFPDVAAMKGLGVYRRNARKGAVGEDFRHTA